MQNKNETISRHCGRGPRVQDRYKEKTTLSDRLDPGSMSGMTTRSAFTLIELLVVVLIIGILAAVAVPQYQKAVIKSRYASLKVLTKALADAEERYYLANNEYTNDLDKLDIQTPPFISEVKNTNHYRYFDWGYCSISSKMLVECENDKAKLSYGIYFLHSGIDISAICTARNTDLSSIQNQFCKSETRRKTVTNMNTEYSYASWAY